MMISLKIILPKQINPVLDKYRLEDSLVLIFLFQN